MSDEPELTKELGEAEPVETIHSELEPSSSDVVSGERDSEAAIDAALTQAATAESTAPEAETPQDFVADAAIAGAAATGASAAASAASTYARAPQVPRQDQVEKETLYIGNLFFDVTEEDLKKEFEKFGPILRAKVITDNRGLSKGYVDHSVILLACYSVILSSLTRFNT